MKARREDSTMAKDSTKKKAPARSKAEIAQEALDVKQRTVERFEGKVAETTQALADLRVELAAAVKARDYAALNPDLPASTQATEPVEVPES